MAKAQLKTVEQPTQLIPVETVNAVALFSEDATLQDLLERIEAEASALVPDLKTVTSRKEIAANAYNVARSKTAIDTAGKDLVAGEKARLKKIDDRRKYAREFLDNLRDRVRQPLTDWEAEQEAIAQAQAEQDALNAAEEEAYHLHDLWLREEKIRETEAKLQAEQDERDRIEAARLEDEARRQREEQIRKDAQAEAERKAAQDLQAERDRADKAEREKLEAIEQERIRVAREQAEEEAERERLAEIERKRAASRENQRAINNQIVADFVQHGFTEAAAMAIVTLVVQKKINHMEIKY